MRVIAEINHPRVKISIFYMNQKYLVKFEQASLEQTYKLSELDYLIKDVEDVKSIVTDEMISEVLALFDHMRSLLNKHTEDL